MFTMFTKQSVGSAALCRLFVRIYLRNLTARERVQPRNKFCYTWVHVDRPDPWPTTFRCWICQCCVAVRGHTGVTTLHCAALTPTVRQTEAARPCVSRVITDTKQQAISVIFYTLFVPVEITASEFVHHTAGFCIKDCTLEIRGNLQSLVEIPERKRTFSRPRSRWEDSIKMYPGMGYEGVSWAVHKAVPHKKQQHNDT